MSNTAPNPISPMELPAVFVTPALLWSPQAAPLDAALRFHLDAPDIDVLAELRRAARRIDECGRVEPTLFLVVHVGGRVTALPFIHPAPDREAYLQGLRTGGLPLRADVPLLATPEERPGWLPMEPQALLSAA